MKKRPIRRKSKNSINSTESAERNIMKATLYQVLKEYWKEHCEVNGVGNTRNREFVIHRHAFCVACEKYASLTLKSLASIVDRDHATVLHAKKNHEMNYRFDSEYHHLYNQLETDIISIVSDSGLSPKEINVFESVSEELLALRSKNMKIVGRMRKMKIEHLEEVNMIQNQLKHYEFIKRQNSELYERNKALQEELKRVKNLL